MCNILRKPGAPETLRACFPLRLCRSSVKTDENDYKNGQVGGVCRGGRGGAPGSGRRKEGCGGEICEKWSGKQKILLQSLREACIINPNFCEKSREDIITLRVN